MKHYYLDTSAAIKLYVTESGTMWLRELLMANSEVEVVSSQLLQVELWSGFTRRLRDGSVSLADYTRMQDWFVTHRQTLYQIVSIQAEIVQLACELIERQPLRGYDSVHLATALTVNQRLIENEQAPLIFLSADNRLNAAAQAEGLAVDNPNEHS